MGPAGPELPTGKLPPVPAVFAVRAERGRPGWLIGVEDASVLLVQQQERELPSVSAVFEPDRPEASLLTLRAEPAHLPGHWGPAQRAQRTYDASERTNHRANGMRLAHSRQTRVPSHYSRFFRRRFRKYQEGTESSFVRKPNSRSFSRKSKKCM